MARNVFTTSKMINWTVAEFSVRAGESTDVLSTSILEPLDDERLLSFAATDLFISVILIKTLVKARTGIQPYVTLAPPLTPR